MAGYFRLLLTLLLVAAILGCRSLGIAGEYQAYHPDGTLRVMTVRGDTIRLEMVAPDYGKVHIGTFKARREGNELVWVENIETGVGSDMLIKSDAEGTLTVEEGGRTITLRGSIDQGFFGRQEIVLRFRKTD